MGMCFCTGACRNGQGCAAAGIPATVSTDNTGWTCPNCGKGNAPWVIQCDCTSGPVTLPQPIPSQPFGGTCPICGGSLWVCRGSHAIC